MSSLDTSGPALAARSFRPPLAKAAAGLVRHWLHKLVLEIEIRRALRQISTFDDVMLHDIGLDRGGLEHPLRHGNNR